MLDFRISNAEEMERAIRETGIIPFFTNCIPGYSIQELTKPGYWFDGEEDSLGPWDWKIHCIQCGDIAYGKFLCGGKASFATVPFYKELMNYRRSKEHADERGRTILARLQEQGSISIKEVRDLLGLKKSAADAAVSKLQHQCLLLTGDIIRVYNGPNLTYKGWQRSSFCTPEALFESEAAPSPFAGFPFENEGLSLATDNTPEESKELLIDHISGLFPGKVTLKQILKILA